MKDGFLINPTVVDARTEITTAAALRRGLRRLVHGRRRRGPARRPSSSASSRSASSPTPPTSSSARPSSKTPCAIRSAARSASRSSSPSARTTPPSWRRSSTRWPTACSPASTSPTSPCRSPRRFPTPSSSPSTSPTTTCSARPTSSPAYKTSKARVCVTVGMMTTGYDCTDILNLGLFRPIFSPTDFIQIKGRGTRKHNFLEQLFDDSLKDGVAAAAEDRLQALRLLRQLRILRGGVQLRRSAEAPPAPGQGPR